MINNINDNNKECKPPICEDNIWVELVQWENPNCNVVSWIIRNPDNMPINISSNILEYSDKEDFSGSKKIDGLSKRNNDTFYAEIDNLDDYSGILYIRVKTLINGNFKISETEQINIDNCLASGYLLPAKPCSGGDEYNVDFYSQGIVSFDETCQQWTIKSNGLVYRPINFNEFPNYQEDNLNIIFTYENLTLTSEFDPCKQTIKLIGVGNENTNRIKIPLSSKFIYVKENAIPVIPNNGNVEKIYFKHREGGVDVCYYIDQDSIDNKVKNHNTPLTIKENISEYYTSCENCFNPLPECNFKEYSEELPLSIYEGKINSAYIKTFNVSESETLNIIMYQDGCESGDFTGLYAYVNDVETGENLLFKTFNKDYDKDTVGVEGIDVSNSNSIRLVISPNWIVYTSDNYRERDNILPLNRSSFKLTCREEEIVGPGPEPEPLYCPVNWASFYNETTENGAAWEIKEFDQSTNIVMVEGTFQDECENSDINTQKANIFINCEVPESVSNPSLIMYAQGRVEEHNSGFDRVIVTVNGDKKLEEGSIHDYHIACASTLDRTVDVIVPLISGDINTIEIEINSSNGEFPDAKWQKDCFWNVQFYVDCGELPEPLENNYPIIFQNAFS